MDGGTRRWKAMEDDGRASSCRTCERRRSASSTTSHRKCCRVKPPPERRCSTSRPGVATRTSTADEPARTSDDRSRSHDTPSCPAARPMVRGVSAARSAKMRKTWTARERVGRRTSARRRVTTRGSSDCSTGSAYASVLPEPVGAHTATSASTWAACAASTIGTTAACTGKHLRTPVRRRAAMRAGSRPRESSPGVRGSMIVAFFWRIHAGIAASSSSAAPTLAPPSAGLASAASAGADAAPSGSSSIPLPPPSSSSLFSSSSPTATPSEGWSSSEEAEDASPPDASSPAPPRRPAAGKPKPLSNSFNPCAAGGASPMNGSSSSSVGSGRTRLGMATSFLLHQV
jgi:hypothetical protein